MGYQIIDLSSYYCNKGITYRHSMSVGDFTGTGSSFPAEQLPNSQTINHVNGVPFMFPNKDSSVDNMEFYNQRIQISEAEYVGLHILGTADNGSFCEPVKLIGPSGEHVIHVALSDWISDVGEFGEMIAFECSGMHTARGSVLTSLNPKIWYQEVRLKDISTIHCIEVPDNPGMHFFSLTLEQSEGIS